MDDAYGPVEQQCDHTPGPAASSRCSSVGGFERVFGLQTGEEASRWRLWQAIKIPRYLLNSIIVSTLITVGQVFFCAMAAYAFARLQWRHREKVFAFFLAGLMIPAIFTLLPNFVLIKNIGLVDNMLGIALPGMLMTPFAVFPAAVFLESLSRSNNRPIDGGPDSRALQSIIPMSMAPIHLALLRILVMELQFWPLRVYPPSRC